MKCLYIFFLGLFLCAQSYSLNAVEQKLVVIRHGEAANNIENVYNSNPSSLHYKPADLTEKGKETTLESAKKLLGQGFNNDNITAVFVSPLPRTIQTADILVKAGLVSPDKIIVDNRLIEMQAGDLEGKPVFPSWNPSYTEEYHAEGEEGVKKRVLNFYNSILAHYPKGNIIVVTHNLPAQIIMEDAGQQKLKINPGEAKVFVLHRSGN
jgi:broad specificity phosphatase PhoE